MVLGCLAGCSTAKQESAGAAQTAAPKAEGTTAAAAEGTTAAPGEAAQTGDINLVMVVAIALAALMSAVVIAKKRRFN